MKLAGRIHENKVLVMVDSRASHCFISRLAAANMGLYINHSGHRAVRLGDEQRAAIEGICPKLPLCVGGSEFTVDFFVFELGGVELILGVSWLASLGEVRANRKNMSMKFRHHDKEVILNGDSGLVRREMTLDKLSRLEGVEGGWLIWVSLDNGDVDLR